MDDDRKINKEGCKEISVVVPLFNKREWIVETLSSVLSQTAQPHEVIVVNDGSTDGSADIVRANFPHVLVINQKNAGVASARNAGLKAARCEWVAFLDADDLWETAHLAELTQVIRECPKARLVSTSWVESVDGADVVPACTEKVERKYVDFFRESIAGAVIWTSAAAVHRETVLGMGGFRNFRSSEDSELWTRVALQWLVARSTRVTAIYRRVAGSLMAELGAVEGLGEGRVKPPRTIEDLEKELFCVAEAWRSGLHQVSRDSLRRYLDHLLLRRAKQQLVRGDTRGASGFLSLVEGRLSKRYLALRGLSLAPGFVAWSAAHLRRKVKRVRSTKKRG